MHIDVEVTEDGRLVAPPGLRLRVQAQAIPVEPTPEEMQSRAKCLDALFEEINADADTIVLKPWPEGDPIVEKYRRKGLID